MLLPLFFPLRFVDHLLFLILVAYGDEDAPEATYVKTLQKLTVSPF